MPPTIDAPLLISKDESIALSVHRTQLAVYRIAIAETELIALGDQGRLVAAREDVFAVVESRPGSAVAIRAFADPSRTLALAQLKGFTLEVVDGDAGRLDALPPVIVLDPDGMANALCLAADRRGAGRGTGCVGPH